MKLPPVLLLTLFTACGALTAQTASQSPGGFMPLPPATPPPTGNAIAPIQASPRLAPQCPVGLTAQHLSDGDLVKTSTAHPKGLGQALHLALTDSAHGPIAEAAFAVRGWTPRARASQAASGPNGDALRTLRVHLTPGPDESSVADLWAPGLSAITSVEVVAITYADGSKWTPSGQTHCRVAPDLLMRISR